MSGQFLMWKFPDLQLSSTNRENARGEFSFFPKKLVQNILGELMIWGTMAADCRSNLGVCSLVLQNPVLCVPFLIETPLTSSTKRHIHSPQNNAKLGTPSPMQQFNLQHKCFLAHTMLQNQDHC